MARKKKEPTKEQMITCQSIPSSTKGDGTRQIIKESIDLHDFETQTGEERQQKKNSFEEEKGNIETLGNEENQVSSLPGGLIATEEPSPYQTIDENFEEVPIETIQPLGIIPDYTRPTDLSYPIVAKTSLGYFLLDGMNLVEEARKTGKMTLKCFIEEIKEHSNEELAIRKVSLRVKPRGGVASYAETVRNTTYLKDILLASELDLKVFQHGGSRRREAFSNNKEENITKLLSSRLGKSISSILQYLNHGFLLSDEVLNFLAEREATKDFFVTFQANKRQMITNLKSEQMHDEDIALQLSESMMGWFEKYPKNRKKIRLISNGVVVETQDVNRTEATPAPPPPLPQETSNSQVSAPTMSTETFDEPVRDTETSDEAGTSAEASDENDSFETLKFSVETLAKSLLEASTVSDPDEYLDRITAEAKNLSILVQKACVQRNKRLPFAEEVS